MSFITVKSTDGETTSWNNAEVLGVYNGHLWIVENQGASEDFVPGAMVDRMQNYGIPLGDIDHLMVEAENGHQGDLTFEDSTLAISLEASGVLD